MKKKNASKTKNKLKINSSEMMIKLTKKKLIKNHSEDIGNRKKIIKSSRTLQQLLIRVTLLITVCGEGDV